MDLAAARAGQICATGGPHGFRMGSIAKCLRRHRTAIKGRSASVREARACFPDHRRRTGECRFFIYAPKTWSNGSINNKAGSCDTDLRNAPHRVCLPATLTGRSAVVDGQIKVSRQPHPAN